MTTEDYPTLSSSSLTSPIYGTTPSGSRQQSRASLEKVDAEKNDLDVDSQQSVVGMEEMKEEVHSPDSDFPDGGFKAWLMVVGAVCNTFSTFGFVNSWGIFQAYYQRTILSDSSPSNIAWIGSIQYALVFMPALVVGRLFDLGYDRHIFLSCSTLLIVATFLVAECKEYWQFLLCQGLAVGVASGGIFGPTTAVIAHWFKRRRGLAMGYVSAGASVGATLLPIAVKNLIDRVGFKWTMRVVGFILLVMLGSANLIMKRRLPPRQVTGGLFNWRAFKNPAFTTYCISGVVCFLGLYSLLTFIDISAIRLGVSPDFAFYLVAIANGTSVFGRYSAGALGDVFGPLNIIIPYTGTSAILTYAWPFAKTKGSLIVITAIYGFSIGAYTSLLTNPMMDLGDTSDVGRRLGMFMSIIALGALAGPPVSGAISTATGGFEAVGFYAGSVVILGVMLMALTRHLIIRQQQQQQQQQQKR
ncbi:hypothetical protein AX17_002050 [Amanita inopinata Kibby_2008]|nr:hypothetical protein AX17_002050 [Amanita inopinata Kibby_2008]